MTEPATHVVPGFGLPYADAGVEHGKATATCPVCGHVATGTTPKAAAAAYGKHFVSEAEAGR